MLKHTGAQFFVDVTGFSKDDPTPSEVVIDLTKADIDKRYGSAPDTWIASEANGNIDVQVTNIAHDYVVTLTITGYHTTSTFFTGVFLFNPVWNLPF